MNASQIVESLKGHKGQHLRVAWQRQCKTLKGAPSIQKRVVAFVRTGIDYANLAKVKAGIANGERGPIAPIWNGKGEWAEFPFIQRHKETGREYVRMFPAVFDNLKSPIVSEYLLRGQVVDKQEVAPFLQSCELRDTSPDCFTVKADDVVSVG